MFDAQIRDLRTSRNASRLAMLACALLFAMAASLPHAQYTLRTCTTLTATLGDVPHKRLRITSALPVTHAEPAIATAPSVNSSRLGLDAPYWLPECVSCGKPDKSADSSVAGCLLRKLSHEDYSRGAASMIQIAASPSTASKKLQLIARFWNCMCPDSFRSQSTAPCRWMRRR
jgi:hypothetical protein